MSGCALVSNLLVLAPGETLEKGTLHLSTLASEWLMQSDNLGKRSHGLGIWARSMAYVIGGLSFFCPGNSLTKQILKKNVKKL